MAPEFKTLKSVKISKSLFCDSLFFLNQINLEESENRGPETQRSIIAIRDRKDRKRSIWC